MAALGSGRGPPSGCGGGVEGWMEGGWRWRGLTSKLPAAECLFEVLVGRLNAGVVVWRLQNGGAASSYAKC